MIRRIVISSDKIAYNASIPGRLVHLRLMFNCIHDIFNVYQFVWNPRRNQTDLIHARAELWTRLDESVRHTPRRHMLLVAGDFNTPLDRVDPFPMQGPAVPYRKTNKLFRRWSLIYDQ